MSRLDSESISVIIVGNELLHHSLLCLATYHAAPWSLINRQIPPIAVCNSVSLQTPPRARSDTMPRRQSRHCINKCCMEVDTRCHDTGRAMRGSVTLCCRSVHCSPSLQCVERIDCSLMLHTDLHACSHAVRASFVKISRIEKYFNACKKSFYRYFRLLP